MDTSEFEPDNVPPMYKYLRLGAIAMKSLNNDGAHMHRRVFFSRCALLHVRVTALTGEIEIVDNLILMQILTSRCKDNYLAIILACKDTGVVSLLEGDTMIRKYLRWGWSAPSKHIDNLPALEASTHSLIQRMNLIYQPGAGVLIDVHSINPSRFPPKSLADPMQEQRAFKEWEVAPGPFQTDGDRQLVAQERYDARNLQDKKKKEEDDLKRVREAEEEERRQEINRKRQKTADANKASLLEGQLASLALYFYILFLSQF